MAPDSDHNNTTRVMPDALQAFCIATCEQAGLSTAAARVTASLLVTTDAWGHYSHGTIALGQYLRRVRHGGIDARATARVVQEGAGWAVLDGAREMAAVTGHRAMSIAIAKAEQTGVAYVAVRNSGHYGAAGFYANLAAEQGMIGVSMCNTGHPNMVAPGAARPVLGSNPLAFAIPRINHPPILLDMSTSVVAHGKVRNAFEEGRPIPLGWFVDANGEPTTDPSCWREGAVVPMGGHKGYGLSLVIEILTAVITGGALTYELERWTQADNLDRATGHCLAFLAIDARRIGAAPQFQQRLEDLVRHIAAVPVRDGYEKVLLPGELEWRRWEAAHRDGIPLPAAVSQSLDTLAEETGLQWRPARRG